MAADSAVMVIDASKGVEAQTRKLFKVCVMRDIPIFTFINKMDRDSRSPYDLLDEIEKELGIGTYPMNWPIGSGVDFKGCLLYTSYFFNKNVQTVVFFHQRHPVFSPEASCFSAEKMISTLKMQAESSRKSQGSSCFFIFPTLSSKSPHLSQRSWAAKAFQMNSATKIVPRLDKVS